MHASIVLFVMMVGGPVSPEPEIVTVPLRDDISNPTSIQEMELRERAKAHPLPPVPTIDASQQTGNGGERPAMPYAPTDRNAPRPSQPIMPQAPTSADAPRGPMPYQPGGGAAPPSQFGGASPTAGAPRSDPYANASPAGRNPVYGYSGIPTPAAMPSQTASNYASNYTNSIAQTQARYGLSPSAPTMTADPSGGNKPFSGYQPPSGYSAWNGLQAPTNNGTLNTYTNYVQPMMNQQNFNSHVSEQINGVQTMQRGYGPNPGVETNMGGNGLLNPYGSINYMSVPNY